MHPTRTVERRLELRALLSDWLMRLLLRLSISRRGCQAHRKRRSRAGNFDCEDICELFWLLKIILIKFALLLLKEIKEDATYRGKVLPLYYYLTNIVFIFGFSALLDPFYKVTACHTQQTHFVN